MKTQINKITKIAFLEALKEVKDTTEFTPEEKKILNEKKIVSKKAIDSLKLIKTTIGGTLVS